VDIRGKSEGSLEMSERKPKPKPEAVAAEKFPWFTFVAVQYKSGAWIEERF